VSNFKWGLIGAIGAFVVSILLGIVSSVGVFYIFIRAIIFAVLFFGLGFGMRFILNSFLPELLENESGSGDEYSESGEEYSGNENVVSDNTSGEYAVPELFKSPSQDMGNIEDLISGSFRRRANGSGKYSEGIDDYPEEGYNGSRGIQDISMPEESSYTDDLQASNSTQEKPVFTPSFGDDTGLGGLPDLDMMARAFSGFSGAPAPAPAFVSTPVQDNSGFEQAGYEDSSLDMPSMPSSSFEGNKPASRDTGNKPQALQGDFNPKELAEGLRAVLSKDK